MIPGPTPSKEEVLGIKHDATDEKRKMLDSFFCNSSRRPVSFSAEYVSRSCLSRFYDAFLYPQPLLTWKRTLVVESINIDINIWMSCWIVGSKKRRGIFDF